MLQLLLNHQKSTIEQLTKGAPCSLQDNIPQFDLQVVSCILVSCFFRRPRAEHCGNKKYQYCTYNFLLLCLSFIITD